jgi:hypothetical protein
MTTLSIDTPETQEAIERWRQGKINIFDEMARMERERDEAQATLTDIHRWIERNHPDGFIDSLTFTQNLERVGDRWYDRLDIVERERDEARKELKHITEYGTEEINAAVDLRQRLATALVERDEARIALKIKQ